MKFIYELQNMISCNEIRNITAGSGGSKCTCSYNGCNVGITQYSGQWHMVVQCAGDSRPTHYNIADNMVEQPVVEHAHNIISRTGTMAFILFQFGKMI